MKTFNYHSAKDVKEAAKLSSSSSAFLAGGMTTLPSMKVGLASYQDIIDIKINKKTAGLGIELGGNESIVEQLGLTEEQLPVIGGSVGIVLLIIVGLIYYRRKGREYE